MDYAKELIPVSAILLVIVSMVGLDVVLIGESMRALAAIPISLVVLLWVIATLRVRRRT